MRQNVLAQIHELVTVIREFAAKKNYCFTM